MRKRWFPIGLLGLGLAAAGAVGWRASRPAARAPERLVVASLRQPATALLFVAESSGCLAREGVVLDEHVYELGRDALVLVREGRADVAVAFETPVLRGAFVDEGLRVLTTLHAGTGNVRLLTRRDLGVLGPAELPGRRVGVTRGTSAEFFLDTVLRYAGVARASVTVVDGEPEALLQGLLRGELDGAALFDPAAHRAEAALGPRVATSTSELYLEASLLTTRDDVVATRRPALERLIRGLVCAERYARERPAETLAAIQGRLPGHDGADLTAQLGRVRWGVGLDHLLLDVLQRQREWLEARGEAGKPPDLARLVERAPLEAVAPDRVLLLPPG